MFSFLYALLDGQHADLPRRRRDAPAIEFDGQTFVSVDGPDRDTGWLGRGELPGRAPLEAASAGDQSIVDEMRELAHRPPTR